MDQLVAVAVGSWTTRLDFKHLCAQITGGMPNTFITLRLPPPPPPPPLSPADTLSYSKALNPPPDSAPHTPAGPRPPRRWD